MVKQDLVNSKAMPKISARNLIPWELLRWDFKRKNNINKKRLWVWQIFMERHLKGEFHVLVKELKLFDHEFSSTTLLLDILTFRSDVSVSLFCLILCCIQQFHWLIILSNNLFPCGVESNPKRKKKSSSRKINYCVFSWELLFFRGKIIAQKEKIVNSYK